MKIRAAFAVLLAATAFAAAPAAAQNMTGTWTIMSEGRRGSQTQTLTVRQEGAALTGTLAFQGGGPRGGGGGGGGQAVEISSGSVEGATFTFTVALEFGGRGSVSLTYSGTYESDFMEGTIEGGRGGGGQPFMGTRAD